MTKLENKKGKVYTQLTLPTSPKLLSHVCEDQKALPEDIVSNLWCRIVAEWEVTKTILKIYTKVYKVQSGM